MKRPESPYQFAVRTLQGDPDIRAIEMCCECHGLGDVYVPGRYETVRTVSHVARYGHPHEVCRPVWREEYRERCEACRGTGVANVERYSEQPEEPEMCYGVSRLPSARRW